MVELDLAGLLHGRLNTVSSALDETDSRAFGVTVGSVTTVGTGKNVGSVKLKLTMLSEDVETDWAPVVSGWAGRGGIRSRGAYLPPAVDDQALVAFRQGEPRHAYVLGFLWSQDAPPPEATEESLQRHGLYGGQGNTIVLDDTPGKVKVQVTSAAGHRIELDDAGKTVTISAATGNQKTKAVLTLSASGVSVEATGGDLTLRGDQITLDGKSVTLKSSADMTVQATGALTVTGKPVRIN
jgi:uncharacterized protein involved in type VI secretion and phage assembly